MRDESVILTLTSSAEMTVVGNEDLPSPTIGRSKSWAEITTGRDNWPEFDGVAVESGVDVDTGALAFEVVSVVAVLDEHAKIVATKTDAVSSRSEIFLVTIAISIY